MAKHSPDPVIDEIRAIRHQISAEFGHDPQRYIEYLMKLQEQHRDRLVGPPTQWQPPLIGPGIIAPPDANSSAT